MKPKYYTKKVIFHKRLSSKMVYIFKKNLGHWRFKFILYYDNRIFPQLINGTEYKTNKIVLI